MKKLKGFTLIEIMVTSLLVGFLGLGSIFMVSNSTTVLNASSKQAFANGNIQSIMRDISTDIKGGIILTTTSNKNLIITYDDGTKVEWYFDKSKLYRIDSSGTAREILFHGAKDIIVDGDFTPDLSGKYYSAKINMNMTLNDGKDFKVSNITNTYFCRLQVAGFI